MSSPQVSPSCEKVPGRQSAGWDGCPLPLLIGLATPPFRPDHERQSASFWEDRLHNSTEKAIDHPGSSTKADEFHPGTWMPDLTGRETMLLPKRKKPLLASSYSSSIAEDAHGTVHVHTICNDPCTGCLNTICMAEVPLAHVLHM